MSKQKYVKVDPITHIITRPDMYVGSTRSRKIKDYVVIDDKFNIRQSEVDVSPAILRIFIEPLSNMIDNWARSKQKGIKCTKFEIEVDKDTGVTSFWNDGDSIPIEIHETEKCYNHTMIFGQLHTSSNYDDTEDREDISGRNGLGVKLTCVFSKEFMVQGCDANNKKSFLQKWKNNMRTCEEPIVKASKCKNYTRVTYTPDFSQFGLEGYTDDIISLYKRYAVDCAMITKVPVYFNDELIPVTSLLEYSRLYRDHDENKEELFIKTPDCEVVVIPSKDEEFTSISFANGVYTPLGGTHVDSWTESLFRPLLKRLTKKKNNLNIGDIKKFFTLFVTATVKNPKFDSQSKTKLEEPEVKALVKKTQLDTISKWSVMDKIEDLLKAKDLILLKKIERKKRGHVYIEGLDPANNEGSNKSHECTLIFVEGLSAKNYASWGISKGVFGKSGRDWFGIYPLRGKLLNTRDKNAATIAKNKVVDNIVKALGLSTTVDYTIDENYKKLRYGRILIITDSDVDGLHISALIQNLFHSLYPTLLKRDTPFITAMYTPIVKVYNKKDTITFFDEREYKKYVQDLYNRGIKKIDKKYFKGLGSSNQKDIITDFGTKMVEFVEDEKTFDTMNKAFNKKYSDLRKEWISSYDEDNVVLNWEGDKEEKIKISFSDFINTELIKFSIADCERNIPNIMDGLKEGHRKVLYVSFLRNLKYSGKVLKVAQLAGSVAEKSGYHHGEQNLFNTITGMACVYVGSNNISLLYRDGQFGSRELGGKDAASARYIHTKLDYLTRYIYRDEDDVLLDYREDDGEKVEPYFYAPIIPMVLVNGCSTGIGTGSSCNIPCYNPLDLVDCIKIWLDNNGDVCKDDEWAFPEIKPFYRGYKGEIVKDTDKRYISWGIISSEKGNVTVSELPVGMWTDSFKESLEKLKEEKNIDNYKNYSNPLEVKFVIKEDDDGLKCSMDNLKLYKYIGTNNMVLFSHDGKLKKYNTVYEIIDEFCKVRFEFYIKRKRYILQTLENKIKYLSNKKRFLEEVRDGVIKLFEERSGKRSSRKSTDVVKELEQRGYDKETDEEDNEDEKGEKDEKQDKNNGYGYLLKLQIGSITAEKINKLRDDIASLKEERDTLTSKDEKTLWIDDLEEFKKHYPIWLEKIEEEEKEILRNYTKKNNKEEKRKGKK